MGQYHAVYNVDKKEFIHAHRIDNGLKLMEQVGIERCSASALWLLLANSNGRGGGDAREHQFIGRWAGDKIVVQGDYAETTDQGYIDDTNSYDDISSDVVEMLNEVFQEE